jgi:RNA polymerase sigma-70 factor (ECF subfamily)
MVKETDRGTETHLSDEAAQQLIRKILQGDVESFSPIVADYTPLFYSLHKRLLPYDSPENREDDVQEIFLRIFRALPTFSTGRSFFPWAYTIAINYIRSRGRKKRRWKHIEPIEIDDAVIQTIADTQTDSPEELALAHEAQMLLIQALQEVPASYRQVFVLRIMQGLSVHETAQVLHIPEGTVKNRLYRCRVQLAQWMKTHDWQIATTE